MMKEASPRKSSSKTQRTGKGTFRTSVPASARAGQRTRSKSKSENPPERVRGVRLIGAFIPKLTGPAFHRRPPVLVRLVMDWETLVGPEIGKRSIPRKLGAGVLTVSCCGPVAMELQYAAPQIVERLNGACGLWGEERLVRLRIVQDMLVTPAPEAPRARRADPVPRPEIEDGPLREVLERLGGHIAQRRALRRP